MTCRTPAALFRLWKSVLVGFIGFRHLYLDINHVAVVVVKAEKTLMQIFHFTFAETTYLIVIQRINFCQWHFLSI
jgi:hypothetical protein